MKKRIRNIVKALKEKGLEAILIHSPANISYLIPEANIDGYLLLSTKKKALFTDARFTTALQKTCRAAGIDLIEYKFNIFEFIAKKISGFSFKSLGIEDSGLSYKEFKEIEKKLSKINLVCSPASGIVEDFRQIKDKSEINKIVQSAKISLQALQFAKQITYPGMNEKYLALQIESFLKLKGDQELAFQPIVATGISSCEPHHNPANKIITENQPVLIDLGSKYYGYCADLTRVFFLSKMPKYIKKVFNIVKSARQMSIEKIRAGRKIKLIDKTARDYISKKGFGKYFIHSTGHGVGLQVHEKPYINARNQEKLQEGMVLAIEPAIYIPGKFGIREESMVLVKKRGCEVLDERI